MYPEVELSYEIEGSNFLVYANDEVVDCLPLPKKSKAKESQVTIYLNMLSNHNQKIDLQNFDSKKVDKLFSAFFIPNSINKEKVE